MASERASRHTFFGISALLFAFCAVLTTLWSASMSAMGGMPMPGGWTMSMAWMRMPGQTWPGAAADLRAMAVVTAGITVERLAPDGQLAARAIGVVVVGAGLCLIARSAGLG